MRNAYYCAVADIAMEAAQRASDIATSLSSSDRDAFSLVPALDSAQFSALVDSHRRATQGRTPLVRSAATPPVATKAGFSPTGTAPRPFGMHRTRSLPLSNSMEPCLLEPHMLSATDAFPDMTPADQRHMQAVIGDHFSDIDEDEQEDEATSQSLDTEVGNEAHSRTDDDSVAHAMGDDVAVDMTTDVAAPAGDADGTFGSAHPHRGTRAGSCSASHLSTMATPPTDGDTTETAAPAAKTVAASPPPDMTVGTADGATAAAAFAVDTGVDVDTDPDPAATAPPATEHISSFLLHIRRCADDKAAGLVLDAAPSDTGTGVAVGSAPGVAVPVVTTDPAADMDVDTADDLFDGVVNFDPTLAWGIVMRPQQQYRFLVLLLRLVPPSHQELALLPMHTARRQRNGDGRGSHTTTRATRRHCQRMAGFETARGNTPGSDPGPVEGHPAEDGAEWRRG